MNPFSQKAVRIQNDMFMTLTHQRWQKNNVLDEVKT